MDTSAPKDPANLGEADFSTPRDFLSYKPETVKEEFAWLSEFTESDSLAKRLITDPELCTHNRWKKVLAFGDNLAWVDPDSKSLSSYVHANYVNFPSEMKRVPAFIAGQAPLPIGMENFLSLVFAKKIGLIITLVEPNEVGTKALRYWPDVGHQEKFGNFEINCSSLDHLDFVDRRVLSIKNAATNEQIELTHLHFLGWKDMSIPHGESLDAFISLFSHCIESHEKTERPVFVHCSAGVGRTGTFMAGFHLWALKRQAEAKGDPFKASVFSVTKWIKELRNQAVETETQYRFLYDLAARLVQSGSKSSTTE